LTPESIASLPCPDTYCKRVAAADSLIRDGLNKIRIERGCTHAAKWRLKVVR